MSKKFKRSSLIIGFLDIVLVGFLIFDSGFGNNADLRIYKLIGLPAILLALVVFNIYKYWRYRYQKKIQKRTETNLIVLCLLIITEIVFVAVNYRGSLMETFFADRAVLEYGLLFYFFIRLTFLMRLVYRIYFNPAVLFVGSYLIVILAGTFLLMLPSAHNHPIIFKDALFTSTSAVCVTGLLVLDVSREFTFFGQTIIMGLIQIGGLGMLTFTSFFAYFFKSGASFKESLFMKNVLGDDQLNDIMKTTMRIVVFSLVVEIIGAIFIYDSIRGLPIDRPAFFAVFHAVSAYCNAGFSTISGNLGAPMTRFNYYLQWIVMALIIFGGIGYFISFNFIQYIKQFFINLFQKRKKKSIVRVITLNTKIVVYTTGIIIITGTVAILFSQYNTVLTDDHTWFGKWTTSMFSVVTARTSGFNTIDYSQFTLPGLLIIILVMWIGASPGSTGGGIKTSSFALAVLNIFSTSKDKPHIEIGTRRVAPEAVRRAFSIIIISLISIGLGIFLVLIFDPGFTLMEVGFEIFSAFSTTGLSMGITDNLSTASEYVIIAMMFFGRIGLINLMAGMLRSVSTQVYEYPKENILIN